MGTYSFKSVGKTKENKQKERLFVSPSPVGIKTPLRLGGKNGEIFDVYYDLRDTIRDNLRNLVLTNWGERVGIYNFGANLRPLLTELNSQNEFDDEAIERISSSVSRWMPFISLENFSSAVNRYNANESIAKIELTITYRIPTLSDDLFTLVVQLNAI